MQSPIDSFVSELVSHYAKMDREGFYNLSLDDLPDFEVHKLAALIMADDESRASESTGADNELYTKSLLPSLIRFLKDTVDRDEEIEFVKAWRDGVTKYFSEEMQKLIDDECTKQSHDEHNDHGLYGNVSRETGEFYWGRP